MHFGEIVDISLAMNLQCNMIEGEPKIQVTNSGCSSQSREKTVPYLQSTWLCYSCVWIISLIKGKYLSSEWGNGEKEKNLHITGLIWADSWD